MASARGGTLFRLGVVAGSSSLRPLRYRRPLPHGRAAVHTHCGLSRDHTDTHCPEVLLPRCGPRSDSWPSLPALGRVGPVSALTHAGARALRLACGSSVLTDVLRQLALAVRVSGLGLPWCGNGRSSRAGFRFAVETLGSRTRSAASPVRRGKVVRPSAAAARSTARPQPQPLLPTTSDQTRRPAELKHISKRRKRN